MPIVFFALKYGIARRQQCVTLSRIVPFRLTLAVTMKSRWLGHTRSQVFSRWISRGRLISLFPSRSSTDSSCRVDRRHCQGVMSFAIGRSLHLMQTVLSCAYLSPRGLQERSPVSPFLFLSFHCPVAQASFATLVFRIYGWHLSPRCRLHTGTLLAFIQARSRLNFPLGKKQRAQLWSIEVRTDLLRPYTLQTKEKPRLVAVTFGHCQLAIPAAPKTGHIRWPGIHFDQRLELHSHIKLSVMSSLRAIGVILDLGSTFKGIPAIIHRRISHLCYPDQFFSRPILFFEASHGGLSIALMLPAYLVKK